MTVNGQFDQFGKLTVRENSQLRVSGRGKSSEGEEDNDWDMVLRPGSQMTVNGAITITNTITDRRRKEDQPRLSVRGDFEGTGTINGETIEHLKDRLAAGKSPGVLTLNGDCTQFPRRYWRSKSGEPTSEPTRISSLSTATPTSAARWF